MVFEKKGSVRRLFIFFFIVALFFSLYLVVAQESAAGKGSVALINVPDSADPDYKGYQLLDMDDDNAVTEEDLSLKLEEINQQLTTAKPSLAYIQTTYGMTFTLSPITTNAAIKNSKSSEEYQSYLLDTGTELGTLAADINEIQNAIGDLDWNDPEIARIKAELDAIDNNIFLAMWYTGRG